jgi:flagellar protein FliO/FliZ
MQAVTFMLAFVAVLGLIVLAAWLVRRFANNRLGANTNRGRMPRLAVIDAAAVDGRRRLVLVRRDNVEHLLMIGGPTDIVVEPNIVRAQARGDQLPQRPPGAEPPPRIAPLPDAASWLNGEDHHPEQQTPEPPRPARPSFADDLRRPERRSEGLTGLTGLAPEPANGRPEPKVETRPEPRPEPIPQRMARNEPLIPRPSRQPEPPLKVPAARAERAAPSQPPPPAPPTPPAQTADQNLAEMAQRLEAALRRPTGSADAPPVAPEPQPARAPRTEPAPSTKTSFENLEEEMASLLGRPKSPSSS